MPDGLSEHVPLCPRCGYDQSGACSWTDACPLEGTCPECGLVFEWADAFYPSRKRLPWLFEHMSPGSPGVIRAWRSWVMALIPPRFWRRVTPAHGTSLNVVVWPVVLMASMIAVGGALRVGFLYAIGWAGAWTAWGGGPPTGWDRAAVVAAEAWGQPLWVRWYDYWGHEHFWRAVGQTYAPIAAVLAPALVCALTLMCLTTSRRICGVRSGHIVRAMTYRLAPLGVLYVLWFIEAMFVSYRMTPVWGFPPPSSSRVYVLVVLLVWGAWWWRTALLTGWAMPKAKLAANLIAVCDVLASVVVYSMLSPYSIGRLLT